MTTETASRTLTARTKPKPNEQTGFQVLKLTQSHFKAWEEYSGEDLQQLQSLFDESQDPLVKGWNAEGLLSEIMLLEGFPLDSRVAELAGMKGNTVRVVTSEHCAHRLLVCLDRQLKDSTVNAFAFQDADVLVCLDAALTDEAKQRLSDLCTLKAI